MLTHSNISKILIATNIIQFSAQLFLLIDAGFKQTAASSLSRMRRHNAALQLRRAISSCVEEGDYLRKMLSRRQLQALVRRRAADKSQAVLACS